VEQNQKSNVQYSVNGISGIVSASTAPRMMSVDALRGFDMFWILGVDALIHEMYRASGGNALLGFLSRQLTHRDWEGLAFYDLIFPLFIFLAGVSIVFSLGRLKKECNSYVAHVRLFRRALLIYLLGVLFYGGMNSEGGWAGIRWVGVLQQIAISYFVAGFLFLHLRLRGLIAACVFLLGSYWALLTFVPVPGIEHVSFAAGENLANYLDSRFLPGRLWCGTWDPQGLLCHLATAGSCLLGVFAGLVLTHPSIRPERKAAGLIMGGIVVAALGLAWGGQFPIVKNIWTSSFALVTGGISAVLLGLFYWVVDILQWRRWCVPFVWIGTNALTLYLLVHLVDFRSCALLLTGGPVQAALGEWGLSLTILVAIALMLSLARFLYNRRIFLRL
jgi:predicted acyltransferase